MEVISNWSASAGQNRFERHHTIKNHLGGDLVCLKSINDRVIKPLMCLWLPKPVIPNRPIVLKMTSVHHSHVSFSFLLHNTKDSVCCGQNIYICSWHQCVTYHSSTLIKLKKSLQIYAVRFKLTTTLTSVILCTVFKLCLSWLCFMCIDVRQMCKYNEV